jgi:hypothetical protein
VVSGIPLGASWGDHFLAMICYLVELYAPRGITRAPDQIQAAIGAAGVALRYVRTILVPDDETCFCLIEAPSASAVAELAAAAGVETERIVEAVDLV